LLEGVQIQSVVSSTAAAAAPSAATLMKTVSAAAAPTVTVSSVTIPAAGGNTVNLTMAAHQKLLAGQSKSSPHFLSHGSQ